MPEMLRTYGPGKRTGDPIMTPEEYLKSCCDPGVPVGYTCCLIDKDAKENGWTLDQVAALKYAVEKKYRESVWFQFPRKVRYI